MQTHFVAFEEVGPLPFPAASATLRGQVGSDRTVEVAGLSESIVLVLTPPPVSRTDVFTRQAILAEHRLTSVGKGSPVSG